MLHVTNGEATRGPLQRSGVPGTIVSWDDVLHDGPTPLVTGDEWIRVRARYLASVGYGDEDEMLRDFRAKGDPLDAAGAHDEVVFWFEHDLYDQLLLIRHLWWLSNNRPLTTRFSIVIGTDYLGLLAPKEFPSRFARRRPIADEEVAAGAAAWTAFCGDDPRRLVPLARAAGPLAYLPRAMHRLLEEFPAADTGLSRSERQILDVLAEGPRSPGQAFVACAKLEDDIWMGDWSFWTIVKRLAVGAHPLVAADVRTAPRGLPEGTLAITDAGRQVRTGRADHIVLNAPSRWIGGTLLTPARAWRWTGSSLQPAAP
jgi:Domain of unknown function (DUF1835)